MESCQGSNAAKDGSRYDSNIYESTHITRRNRTEGHRV